MAAKDRLDQGEQELVLILVIGVHGDRAGGALIKGRQPGVVRLDVPHLDGEEDIGAVGLDGGHHFLQRRDLRVHRQVELHLVEAHRALVGEKLPPLVDHVLGGERVHQLAGDKAADVRRVAEHVPQGLQGHQGRAVLVRASGLHRTVGLIHRDHRRLAGEGDGVELDIAVLLLQRRPVVADVAEVPQLHPLLHRCQRRVAKRHLRDHAKGAQIDPGGVIDLRMVVGAAVEDIAAEGGDPEGLHLPVNRLETKPRPVRAGAQRPADGLLVDIRQVAHLLPDLGEGGTKLAQPRARAHLRGQRLRIMVQHAAHPVEGQKGPGRRHQRLETVAGAHRADRPLRGLQEAGELVLIRRRGPALRIGGLDPRPVAPDEAPGPVRRRRAVRLPVPPQAIADSASRAPSNKQGGPRQQRASCGHGVPPGSVYSIRR